MLSDKTKLNGVLRKSKMKKQKGGRAKCVTFLFILLLYLSPYSICI